MPATIEKIKSVTGKEYAKVLLECVQNAKSSIDILMFEWRWYTNDFSNPVQLINHALVGAVRRGVSVRAITNNEKIADVLLSVGINAKVYPRTNLMHSKMIIIDKVKVLMGSHNLTMSAVNSNIETSVLFHDEDLAKTELDHMNNLWLL